MCVSSHRVWEMGEIFLEWLPSVKGEGKKVSWVTSWGTLAQGSDCRVLNGWTAGGSGQREVSPSPRA